jgi:release factor glutamine methyltransferase
MLSDHASTEAALAAARSYGEALRLAIRGLRSEGTLDSPELDAQVMLAAVTGMSRSTILAFPERELTPRQAASYAAMVARRLAHEPVAYLIGHREFMGLDLLVDPRVLIPRPETELLVEEALAETARRFTAGTVPIVADIGTGSGAIALSLAIHEPRLSFVYAVDVSADALSLARANASRLGIADRIAFLEGDLFDALPEPLDLLLANLPYVAPADEPLLPTDVSRYEPRIALYGDEDGLGHLRRLLRQAPVHLKPGATLILEYGYNQQADVEALAGASFPGSARRFGNDYAGWSRYAVISTP